MKKTATSPTQADPGPEAAARTAPAMQGEVTQKAHFEYIPIKMIKVVRNTRKTFDDGFIHGLAESIRLQGILQNLVVRPGKKGYFELAAGENRLRAAKLAGLTEVPCSIRELDDHQFLEVQLLENMQRQDVPPAEEAAAFAELLANGFTATEIAHKIGSTAQFVAQRAQLMKLTPHWLKKLRDGELTIGAANELARLPKDIQERGQKDINMWHASEDDKGRQVLTAGIVKRWVTSYVFINLHEATFPKDDENLVPGCGPCGTCAKRTGTQGLLFADLGTVDNCLDKLCFDRKKQAFVDRKITELKEQQADIVLVSRDMWQTRKNALGDAVKGWGEWDIEEKAAPGSAKNVVQALVVDGPDAGQLRTIRLRGSQAGTEESAADRRAALRKGKIELRYKELLAEAFLEAYLNPGTRQLVLERLLDDLINGLLTRGVSELTKANYARLVTRHGWAEEETRDSDWRKANLARMTLEQKGILLVDLKARENLTTEYYNSQQVLAKLLPELIDLEATRQRATDLVDHAPNPASGKKKKATAEEPAQDPATLTFVAWCRTKPAMKTPAQERILQGILEDKKFPEDEGLLLMQLHIEQKGGTPEHQQVLREIYKQFEAATAGREEVPA